MSVFDQPIDKMQEELLNNILEKYNAKDVELNEVPDTHLRADRILYVLDKVKSEVNDIIEQMDEAEHFYLNEIEKKKKNISYLEQMLEYFIDNQSKKTIKLPNGTLRMRTTKKYDYPDNESLIDFCKVRKIPTIMTEKADLTIVKKYIKETGDVPEGLEIIEVTNFSYNTKEGQH